MTKNRLQPTRYRPGKAEVDEVDSEDESDNSEEESEQATLKAPPPKASSFPSQKKLAVDLSKAEHQKSAAPLPQSKKPDDDSEGFVTASESSEDEAQGSESDDDDEEESEEESSAEDEPKKPMLRPTFLSKAQRSQQASAPLDHSAEHRAAEEEHKRKEKADELLQAHLERDAAARAAGRKAWDDDADIAPEDEVNDEDGLDPEAEYAAWKLRELKRVRRDRLAIEEKEREREEIERRRNMSAEEREAEDRAYIDAQKEEREGKGKMGFMQKYHHKGAFFIDDEDMQQDEEVKAAMSRDLAGARYVDDAGDKAILPEYMRIRDMTRLGKKGRTKYKDLRSEDTGRWGELGRKRRAGEDGVDERFRPDEGRDGGSQMTGANEAPLGERRRREDADASKRPRYG